MKLIAITRGLYTAVDDEDFDFISQFSWQARPVTQKRENWYVQRTVARKTVILHRLLLDAPAGAEVDHADGNGLNNTRENLRICSRSLNCANVRGYQNRTGFRGVSLQIGERDRPYRGSVYTGGKEVLAGYFYTAEAAAKARDALAIQIFGQFAQLNFPIQVGVAP